MKKWLKDKGYLRSKAILLTGLGAAVVWTVLVGLVLMWDIRTRKNHSLELAYIHAVESFNKNVELGSWTSKQGGVYAAISDNTPSSPNTTNITEHNIITPSRRKFTLVNPMDMIRHMSEIEYQKLGDRSHLTSLNPMRPENNPDPWERTALNSIEKGAYEVTGMVDIKGQQYLRLIRPFIIEQSCMSCHAGQGYKVGDIRGGLTVEVPMKPYENILTDMMTLEVIITGVVWLVGFLFFAGGGWYLQERRNKDHQNISILRLAAQTTEALFAQPATGIAEIDAQTGRFIRLNRKFCEITGTTKDQLLGELFTGIIHPEEVVTHADLFNRVLKGEIFDYSTDKRFLRKDGQTAWVHTTIAPLWVTGESPTSFVAVILDISEKRRAEQETRDALEVAEHSRLALLSLSEDQQSDISRRRHAEDELKELNQTLEQRVAERTNELETLNKELEFHCKEIEQLTYIASHDLQEPLRTLTNFSQLMKEDYAGKLDEDGNKYIDFINNSSSRMRTLVTGMLDYSLIGKETVMTYVDCNKIVEEVLSDMPDAIKANNATITVEELPTINAYATELRLLFQNLVSNAIKFRKKEICPVINISVVSNVNESIFSIKDNGIGIDEKDKEKIFIIFQRMHNRNEYDGTGIGLAHCKKIVELHGGKIWVESKLCAGSNIFFTIPKR